VWGVGVVETKLLNRNRNVNFKSESSKFKAIEKYS